MNRLIIIEGPQGTGKTTLANYLRENISGSNLYRLSGQKDKTEKGLKSSITMYNALFNYLKDMESVPMTLIFDRTFFTEEVYSRLGYKEYSFHDEYLRYLDLFKDLNYEIYYISLSLKDTSLYEKRLKRVHHNYQAFSLESSVAQQNTYLEIANDLKNIGINVTNLEMDDFDTSYKKINEMFNI